MDWAKQAKIADIEKSLLTARGMRDAYVERVDELEAMLREVKAPFEVGQEVTPLVGRGRGGRCTVVAIERAFGDWVVQVKYGAIDRIYTYMAKDLGTGLENGEVPF